MRPGLFGHGAPWIAGAGLILTLALQACASKPVAAVSPVISSRPAVAAPRPVETPNGFAALSGWGQEDHLAAFEAYVAGCGVATEQSARAVCADALRLAAGSVSPSVARVFFETRFDLVPATGEGMLTAYFAPEYAARRRPDALYDRPVLARPADLVRAEGGTRGFVQRRPGGGTGPYPDRAAIEADPPSGDVLAWMKAEDLFFLQIQGSGYLTFEDGSRARAAYAADNGRPFVGIARPMAERGLLSRDSTSGDAIRAWLADHRGPEADAVTALNPRYIFFTLGPDDGGHPSGAAGVPLTARRAIAVDPASWRYGDLVWLSADGGNLRGATASYRGLVMALDTGSAIRGPVRADLYLGRGEAAGDEAGRVRHPLRLWRLVPRA